MALAAPINPNVGTNAKLSAMFKTAAEVLGGLIKAFHDYEQKNESAWRKAS